MLFKAVQKALREIKCDGFSSVCTVFQTEEAAKLKACVPKLVLTRGKTKDKCHMNEEHNDFFSFLGESLDVLEEGQEESSDENT